MTIRWTLAPMLLAGCTEEPAREIPVYEEGVVVEGDCGEEGIVATDAVALVALYAIEKTYDPRLQIDRDLPNDVGQVVTTQRKYEELMGELNFDLFYVPSIDFEEQQVGAVWYQGRDSCGIEIETVSIRTRSDGSAVFDVELLDTKKNCDDNCTLPSQALVIDAFTNEIPVTVCRRIRPGCSPG